MIRLESTSTSILVTCSECPFVDEYRSLDEAETIELIAEHALCSAPTVPGSEFVRRRPYRRVGEADRVERVLERALARMDVLGYPPARPCRGLSRQTDRGAATDDLDAA